MERECVMNEPAMADARYGWDDYRSWPDTERWELIGGAAYAMSPSPGVRHQALAGALYRSLAEHLEGKACRPFIAPLDVKLSESDVVQPDILVVCNPTQVHDTHIEGAPALVVEVISPASEKFDRITKHRLYEQFAIAEYWLVTPYPPLLEIFTLQHQRYVLHAGGTTGECVASHVFPDLQLTLTDLFDLPYSDDERRLLRVKESA